MLKILQTPFIARHMGLLLLASVIVLPSRAATPTLTTLYSFADLADGGFPEAGLVMGSGGTLYGTTSSGGTGWGSVFELIPIKTGGWTETTIYTFTGGADGANPIADLVIGKNNVLYGTTYGGGVHGYGTVFQIVPGAGGVWTQKVLYSFAGGNDGAYPSAGLAVIGSGVLYGTTYGGGSVGMGTIFELLPSGSGWSEKVLYTFQGGTDGANPLADLIVTGSGALLGTTFQGGSVTISNATYSNWGTIFQLTPKGGGVWTESLLYTFTGGTDGGSPESALISGANGILYGSTFWGGNDNACPVSDFLQGCGAVYQVAPPTGGGTTWTESVLYTFTGHNFDGSHPYGKMGLNSTGVLYGTTFSGGNNVNVCFPESYTGCGTLFSLKPPSTQGGTWTKANVMAFPGSPGGGSPNGLILTTGGSMYGTTIVGGDAGGYGTAYLLKP